MYSRTMNCKSASSRDNVSLPGSSSLGIASGNLVPVDNIPPGIEVLRTAVLIFEVIGMLPHVVTQDRIETVRQGVILVGGGNDSEAIATQNKPGPAGAKALHASIIECSLERIERAKLGIDRLCQITARLTAPVGGHALPEQGMIEMAAAVIADGRTNILRKLVKTTYDLFNRQRGKLMALQRTIQIGDVRVVVLVMMQLHRLGIDVRLKRVIVVR